MTNQIKYVLAPLALSVLVGCGEPEVNCEAKEMGIITAFLQPMEKQCEQYYSGQMAKVFECAVEGGLLTQETADEAYKNQAADMEQECKAK